ncbi:Gfo/Idh/MocA family protein [Bacillus sp. REN16]|uniref:Gfo/Idh/MocA family protein n=1 Tax=Bacillus sp. REN16 TaxID=2887296 RepID=UPI001E4ECC17|nr:Gfo/Idh/MocA family oxidoreductase [Bacillus sp. REN16]MCC3355807.1 Gfo/Idh/MocA family oxidoreductase [Bacillus sp. REN16]
MKHIRVGVIGLGAIGERLIQGFNANNKTIVTAVVDTNKERAAMMADKLGGINWYDHHKDMLENEKLDLVYVAVPPKYHHCVTLDVIEKGIHVLCEKPLANSIEEAKEMKDKAEQAGIIHAMNFPLNYSSPVNTLDRLIKEGYIGDLRKLELSMIFPNWPRQWQQNDWVAGREQGGFVLEVGVHFIQLTQRIFGSLSHLHSRLELPEDTIKCETGVIATLELADRTPFLINGMSQIAGDERITYTAYGTKGTLSLVDWGRLEGGKLGEEIHPIESEKEETSTLIDQLALAITGKESRLYTFTDGYEAQTILEKLRNKE